MLLKNISIKIDPHFLKKLTGILCNVEKTGPQ